jgi:hypothetical protein
LTVPALEALGYLLLFADLVLNPCLLFDLIYEPLPDRTRLLLPAQSARSTGIQQQQQQ